MSAAGPSQGAHCAPLGGSRCGLDRERGGPPMNAAGISFRLNGRGLVANPDETIIEAATEESANDLAFRHFDELDRQNGAGWSRVLNRCEVAEAPE